MKNQKLFLTATFVSLWIGAGCAESKSKSNESNNETDDAGVIHVSGTLYIGDPVEDLQVQAFTATEPGEEPLLITDVPVTSDMNGLYSLAIEVSDIAPNTNQAIILMTKSATEKWKYLWSYHEPQTSDIALNLNLMTSLVYEVAKVNFNLTLSGHLEAETLVQEVFGTDILSTEMSVTDPIYEELAAWVLAVQADTDATLSETMVALALDVGDGILDGKQASDEITIIGDEKLSAFGHFELP